MTLLWHDHTSGQPFKGRPPLLSEKTTNRNSKLGFIGLERESISITRKPADASELVICLAKNVRPCKKRVEYGIVVHVCSFLIRRVLARRIVFLYPALNKTRRSAGINLYYALFVNNSFPGNGTSLPGRIHNAVLVFAFRTASSPERISL